MPVPRFGVVMEMEPWEALVERLTGASVHFPIEPRVRFKNQPGEQATLFFLDPSGNAMEFKAFRDDTTLFAT
ncbi:MAG: glyoxalase [Bradyrhizobium sp.]|nr:glyoxalase [Bradyrhizobium sp.]